LFLHNPVQRKAEDYCSAVLRRRASIITNIKGLVSNLCDTL
jgi:hypothetical protein